MVYIHIHIYINFNQNGQIFIQENGYEHIVCKMAVILSWIQRVKPGLSIKKNQAKNHHMKYMQLLQYFPV